MPLRDDGKKCSGILLAVSSLPSKYGIGSFDKTAYDFVDFLAASNQSYWQILPLCPVGKGNSPYSSYGAFAGEILYIDIEELKNQGLIKNIPDCNFEKNVDYDKVRRFKYPLLREAAENFDTENKEYKRFCNDNNYWLQNYAEFMTIRESTLGEPLYKWDEELKFKIPEKIADINIRYMEEIDFYKITQYFFYIQYKKLKDYANKKRIKIIGDIPFYVSPNSADVWGEPDLFMLKRDISPKLVAGVPPDIFSQAGQLWGNPIYNFEYQKKNNFKWWQQRIHLNSQLYDIIRIDHFRAFSDYYIIDAEAENATNGYWEKGIGYEFFDILKNNFKDIKIIAEDLGGETQEVRDLIKYTAFPNMKILQFAFDSDLSDPFLPFNFNENCVCYTGTHDNNTTLGWYKNADYKEKLLFDKLIEKEYDSPVMNLILAGMKSAADTVIIPMQDYLELEENHRMNIPSIENGNWQWRFSKEDLNDNLIKKIKELTKSRN